MDCLDLHDWADVVVILTAIVGLFGYFKYQNDLWLKSRKLEKYLRKVKAVDEKKGEKGQRSILHLVRHVHLTQDEIIQVSFRSKHIVITNKTGPTNRNPSVRASV
jgi:hypothetical protein